MISMKHRFKLIPQYFLYYLPTCCIITQNTNPKPLLKYRTRINGGLTGFDKLHRPFLSTMNDEKHSLSMIHAPTFFYMSYSAVLFIFYINRILSNPHKHIISTLSILNKCSFGFFVLKYIPNYVLGTRISEMFKLKLQKRVKNRMIIGVCVFVCDIATTPSHTILEMHTLPAH